MSLMVVFSLSITIPYVTVSKIHYVSATMEFLSQWEELICTNQVSKTRRREVPENKLFSIS